MLILYYKQSCSFCQRVLQMADNFGVSLDLRDVEEDETALAELLAHGGKQQVPYLVDESRGESMYETSDIIDYLRTHYAGTAVPVAAGRPRVHISSSVCESCEG